MACLTLLVPAFVVGGHARCQDPDKNSRQQLCGPSNAVIFSARHGLEHHAKWSFRKVCMKL